jgi:hypothetical protein
MTDFIKTIIIYIYQADKLIDAAYNEFAAIHSEELKK